MIRRKLGAIALAICILFGMTPVLAQETEPFEVIFTDVTKEDLTTLSGEAKIKVSVKGVAGNVTIAQLALQFTGDLKYKSINFLQGENNPEKGYMQVSPNAALANSQKTLMPSIINAKTPVSFAEETDLFILTFSGEPGASVTLRMTDLKNSYCIVDGTEIYPANAQNVTVPASDKANEGKPAKVTLKMDKVTDFTAGGQADYQGSGVELTLTSETTKGYMIYTVLNNILISKGGHRENETIPTFTVENTVLNGDTYTIEVSGIGYVPYKKTGVIFDQAIILTNADFVPGDVNGDARVDATDKTLCQTLITNREYTEAADFNRDGKVDNYDMVVFDGIQTEMVKVPSKMQKPTLEGGKKQITVSWKKPGDESITGYIIKYGVSTSNMKYSVEVKDASATTKTITDLGADKTYYVAIAAVNRAGTGDFSDPANEKTDAAETTGGGGIGGGGGTGGGGTPTPSETPTQTPAPVPDISEVFNDLKDHAWAKEYIYILKEKGIISGVSDTEFAPASNIKRGDFILILTRMLGVSNSFDTNFADVPENSYYYSAIGAAKAAGIAQGNGENFMPENSITRQDLITLAYRAFQQKGYISETADASSLDVFHDKANISDYAVTAMASMVKEGIIQGNAGSVNPLGNATRAEVAVMCARLLELMK